MVFGKAVLVNSHAVCIVVAGVLEEKSSENALAGLTLTLPLEVVVTARNSRAFSVECVFRVRGLLLLHVCDMILSNAS